MDATQPSGTGPAAASQSGVHIKLTVKHAFGCTPTRLDPIQSFSANAGNKDFADRIVHKVGKQVCVFDPETNQQDFFEGRPRNLLDVVHFSISNNSRFVCMCENIRSEKSANDVGSQVSVYSLTNLNRLKTLHHALPRPFVCATFCGDPKLVAALSDEPDRHIVIWQWEKEKLYKTVSISVSATVLRSAPSQHLMLTTTGTAALKHWCLAPDGSLKMGNFLPTAKESLDIYTDHVWMPSALGTHRLVVLVDPDSSNENNRTRRQSIYLFEGIDSSEGNTSNPSLPVATELRQTIALKLDPGCRVEKILFSPKTFMLVGLNGFVAAYERTDDKQEPYIEARRLSLGDRHLVGGTIYPSEEKMVLVTKQGRLLTMPLDTTIDQLKNNAAMNNLLSTGDDDAQSVASKDDESMGRARSLAAPMDARGSSGISDMRQGGHHTAAILAADAAYERPLIVTIGADSTARVWNYLTGKCELVHYFRNEEPLAVAFHPAGFQFLVSFKDRIRSYNVLIDKVKPFRETVLKNVKCLKYSNGGHLWAAASAVNVVVFETRSFTQLMTFQGHLMSVVRLCWAPGDEVLFSAGMDGNVYGWPVSREGRMEVVAANNRSSAILDIACDAPSTIFRVSNKDSDDDMPSSATTTTTTAATAATSNVANSAAKGPNTAGIKDIQGKDVNPAELQAFQQSIQTTNRSWLVISSLDGNVRMPVWTLAMAKQAAHVPGHGAQTLSILAPTQQALGRFYPTSDSMPIIYGDSSVSVTAMALSADRTKLFIGTSLGSLRVYPWPPEPQTMPPYIPPASISTTVTASTKVPAGKDLAGDAPGAGNHLPPTITHAALCAEFFTHSGPVVSVCLGPADNTVISTAADGSVFVHSYAEGTVSKRASVGNHAVQYDFDMNEDGMKLNKEVVLLALEDIEDHVNEVIELQKLLMETRAKNEFQARKLEVEHNEALKRVSEIHDLTLTKEKESFEKQRGTFDKRIRELMATIESKESDHIKVLTELENKYEHKLADQLERYDMLSEKMQLLKQKCEGLLEAEKISFERQMNDLKGKYGSEEKRYKLENKRAVEDKIANESALKEIINQQEDEYEDELRQLIQAAESELVSERDTILKLRTLVQTKNTKLDQLKKKLIELQSASKARLAMLNAEKTEKQKLLDTIEHYKKNLIEREDALAEKEKLVLELRSKTRTLENFRFVLDHRLQQLSSERGPITSHIEGLEKHIATMYEELVEEFSNKKSSAEASVLKDQKINWISQDLNKMRQNVREKDQFIAAFKRELGNLISSMVVGKELEESVKMLYKKFVRGETGAKSSMVKLNARVADSVNEILGAHGGGGHGLGGHGAGHGSGAKHTAHLDLDDQSFLSTDTPGNGLRGHTGAGLSGTGAGGGLPALGASNGQQTMATKALIRDIEDALVETAKEADRQKKFVERQAANLKHRLQTNQRESHILVRHRLHENSDLLFENNDLRMENKDLLRKISIHKQHIEQLERSLRTGPLDALRPGSSGGGRAPAAAVAAAVLLPDVGAGGGVVGQGGGLATGVGEEAPRPRSRGDGEVAPWVVHNSLPTNAASTPLGTVLVNNRRGDDLDSLHTVEGTPLSPTRPRPTSASANANANGGGYIVGSASMPNLGDAPAAGQAQAQLQAHLASTLNNLSNKHKSSSSILQGSGVNAIRNLHQLNSAGAAGPGSAAGGARGGGKIALTVPQTNKQVEKLSKEIELLAQQLDDTLRQNELYRLEINRLRKQVMTTTSVTSVASVSKSGVLGGGASVDNNVTNSIHNRSSVFFDPSSGGAGEGLDLDEDSNFLHADLYGYPSEGDKMVMRVDGQQSAPHSAQPSRRVSADASSAVTKRSRGGSRPEGGGSGGISGPNELEQFSLQST